MLYVTKADGKRELFNEEKVKQSIKASATAQELQNNVLSHVKSKLYKDIPTTEIHRHIMEFLGTSTHPYSKSVYNLKRAIMALGPTGYPFEDYVADIFKKEGFTVHVRVFLAGACVTHETDVVAQKQDPPQKIMIEAKFHNVPGKKTDIHVALYTKARFDDVKTHNDITKAMIVTNTKVSSDALTYALCNNLGIISWSYPEHGSLKELIEKFSLHPITSLSTLSVSQQQQLLSNHVVLCKDICTNPTVLDLLMLSHEQKKKILEEAHFICRLPFEI